MSIILFTSSMVAALDVPIRYLGSSSIWYSSSCETLNLELY
jgi:hypothetical protein